MLRAPVVNAKTVLSGPCPPDALRALVHSCQRGGVGKGTETRKPSGRGAAKGGPQREVAPCSAEPQVEEEDARGVAYEGRTAVEHAR